ncbi:MAG: STAS domain-containing protein [Thermoguttaceae bacterium]|nr:STAS domain-containing protein [Thermoguttaceae bacterium]MDW8080116.1 STAS domain-containing protein [Thermoguttaceae bacterium]
MDIEILGYSGPVLRMAFVGRIVRDNSMPLTEAFESALGPAGYRQPVVVSFERTFFIDSSGLSFLIQCHKRFTQAGGKLVMHSLTPSVLTLFETMGLHQVFLLAENEPLALQMALADNLSHHPANSGG